VGGGAGQRRSRTSTSVALRADSTSTPARTARITPELPVNSRWFTRFFAAYSERLVRKHFHAVRLLGAPDLSAFAGRPLVIYANHPSWWDPLIALVVWRRLLGDRVPYAPIDAAMLKKYAFFKRLGFFGVDKRSLAGARRFLRVSRELLARPDTLLLITPQGRFVDVRDAAAGFEPGLAHLAVAAPDAVYLPLAMEIAFWEEKRPEVLLRFGEPVHPSADRALAMNARLEAALREASARLAEASIRREVEAFQNLLAGGSGTQPVYDAWRWLKARWRGEIFHPAHGDK
jgi:1-acyl-sn-glycerol-3-phosphate acyltransferase